VTQACFSYSQNISSAIFLVLCVLSENTSALDVSSDGLLCSTGEFRSEISKQQVNLSDENTRAALMQTPIIAGALAEAKSLRKYENITKQQVDLSDPQNTASKMQALNTAEFASHPLPNLATTVIRSPNRQNAGQD
jgi:hypothetical protein